MTAVPFSVDSRLLRELGERLVGRPHIALAELIKNAYDADATKVVVEFTGDQIVVTDDGHGMTWQDFEQRWMRIGSTHKEAQRLSPKFGRPLTGSKGVGRLAVQLLADRLKLHSRVVGNSDSELFARIDWTVAVEAGLLTTATAEVDQLPLEESVDTEIGLDAVNDGPSNSTKSSHADDSNLRHHPYASGVTLVLDGLNQTWDRHTFKELAQEIWPLQPPFRQEDPTAFKIELVSDDDDLVEQFNRQMTAVLELWSARVKGAILPAGTNVSGVVHDLKNPRRNDTPDHAPSRIIAVNLEFVGEPSKTFYYRQADCHIDHADFEIRIFNLRNRQPYGITVGEARQYLNDYGGVHVYDAGFHLPYYGPEADWLRIEMDHSHRRGTSDYLPAELNVTGGAEHLPTNSRIYGIVEVSTSDELRWAHELHEQSEAAATAYAERVEEGDDPTQIGDEPVVFPEQEGLRIQVTRDRLVDTRAYRDLSNIVRAAVDIYAMQQARRTYESLEVDRDTTTPAPRQAKDLEAALDLYRGEMPETVYDDLRDRVKKTTSAIRVEYEARNAQIGLLASLATAGVTALAYEHEVGKQFLVLERIAAELRSGGTKNNEAATDIDEWLGRARATRGLFAPLLDDLNRTERRRLKAGPLVRDVFDQIRGLARGADLVNYVPDHVRLPEATFAEWSALFQNLFINALNAMLDSEDRTITVSAWADGTKTYLDIQDTGYGIDLADAPRFFRPFERESRVSTERTELGLGGTGLGLTIVAMLADEIGCRVEFVEPDPGFSTCAQLMWEDQP